MQKLRVLSKERCPDCADKGEDRAGDNLAVYEDGSKYCFKCKAHSRPEKFTALPKSGMTVADRRASREVRSL